MSLNITHAILAYTKILIFLSLTPQMTPEMHRQHPKNVP